MCSSLNILLKQASGVHVGGTVEVPLVGEVAVVVVGGVVGGEVVLPPVGDVGKDVVPPVGEVNKLVLGGGV